jgi:hypothetical protein
MPLRYFESYANKKTPKPGGQTRKGLDVLEDKFEEIMETIPQSARTKRRDYFAILKILQNHPSLQYNQENGEIFGKKGI